MLAPSGTVSHAHVTPSRVPRLVLLCVCVCVFGRYGDCFRHLRYVSTFHDLIRKHEQMVDFTENFDPALAGRCVPCVPCVCVCGSCVPVCVSVQEWRGRRPRPPQSRR